MKLTNTIQRKLKVSSTQLLYQSAPYQAAILFATGPFVDQLLTDRSVFAHKYTFPVVVSSVTHSGQRRQYCQSLKNPFQA